MMQQASTTARVATSRFGSREMSIVSYPPIQDMVSDCDTIMPNAVNTASQYHGPLRQTNISALPNFLNYSMHALKLVRCDERWPCMY